MRLLLALLVAILLASSAEGQSFWAKKQAGGNVDETLDLVSDDSGNSYITGYFSTSAEINGQSFAVEGLTDVFVSKISSSGAAEWTLSFGGGQSDRGLGIAVDESGNVLVCGFYTGFIDFGNGISLNSNGSQDAFLVKLDQNGTPIWARTGGSSGGSDRANAVAADGEGNVLITGQFSGEAFFGGFTLNASDGTNDVFILKYDSEGNELWAKQGTGESLDRGLSITTDDSDNVYTTGQFSGDISFDNTYLNSIQNAIFLIKYFPDGTEDWFVWGGGSEESIAYDLVSDGSDIFLTGDFGSQLTFLGTPTPITLNSDYSNSVFLVSFAGDGTYNWGASAGSNSVLSSRGLDIDSGTLAIAGFFECRMDDFSEEYGEAAFNSLGFRDCFTATYSNSGQFQWARNFGGRDDDQCKAVSILNDGYLTLAGTNGTRGLIFPVTNAEVDGLSDLIENQNMSITHCGDQNYGKFRSLSGSGGPDGFLVKAIDPARSPLDFYERANGECDTSIPEACIHGNILGGAPVPCPESIIACAPYSITATGFLLDSISFESNFAWSPSGSDTAISLVSEAGLQVVTISSTDGCFSVTDELPADVYDSPSTPLVSDSQGVNDQAESPNPIALCPGESVDIWVEVPMDYTVQWTGGQFGTTPFVASEITVTEAGSYFITVFTPEGCSGFNVVTVDYFELPEDLPPLISLPTANDSVLVCQGSDFNVELLDSISQTLYPVEDYFVVWSTSEGGIQGIENTASVFPEESGWLVVSVFLQSVDNPCTDTVLTQFASDSIFVELVPLPPASIEITGPPFFCPGDTIVLDLDYEGELSFIDFEPLSVFEDSIYVFGGGVYEIVSTAFNDFGCVNSDADTLVLQEVETPVLLTFPEEAVICPGDSVQIVVLSPGEIIWQGPSGVFSADSSVYVQEAGLYFVEVQFYVGCELVSNTVEVSEFATPFLDGSNAVLCPGGEVEISIISTGLDAIQWQPPLSGSDTVQVVDQPGTYSVLVTGCNVTTELSIEVNLTEYVVEIEISDPQATCEGDSILVLATAGLESYQWSPEGSGQEEWFSEPGEVSVIALDEYGCLLSSNILEINFEPIPPLPEFTFDPPCEGDTLFVSVGTGLTVNFVDSPGGNITSVSNYLIIPSFTNDTTLYAFLSSEFCVGPLDSIEVSPIQNPMTPMTGSNAPVCTGENLFLEVINAEEGVSYFWILPNGDEVQGVTADYAINNLSQEGSYFTYGIREGCVGDTTFLPVSLFETRQVELPPDTALCFRDDFTVSTDTVYASYIWSDNSTDSVLIPTESGEFFVTVTDFNGCESFDLMEVDFADCSVDFPNVFTPNGDGLNDGWFVTLDRPLFFDVVIYNRWGRIVYESNDYLSLWDGFHYKSGKPCSEGTYFFILRGLDFEGREFEETGTITLIRN